MLIQSSTRGCRSGKIAGTVASAVVLGVLLLASTAVAQETNQTAPPRSTAKDDDCQQVRKSLQQLTAEVARLKAEVAKLEKFRQVDYLRDLITKEENRVLAAQKELLELGDREIALQKRLDEIETELRPDRIQQSLAGVGSMRPEQQREAVERQLTSEKRRIQSQLDQYRQNRVRLQGVVSNAESSIVTLKQRLKDAVRIAGLRENN